MYYCVSLTKNETFKMHVSSTEIVQNQASHNWTKTQIMELGVKLRLRVYTEPGSNGPQCSMDAPKFHPLGDHHTSKCSQSHKKIIKSGFY